MEKLEIKFQSGESEKSRELLFVALEKTEEYAFFMLFILVISKINFNIYQIVSIFAFLEKEYFLSIENGKISPKDWQKRIAAMSGISQHFLYLGDKLQYALPIFAGCKDIAPNLKNQEYRKVAQKVVATCFVFIL